MALADQARPSTGLCLSGGGTRATCAAIGYLRGLLELGLIDGLRYTSAVSGGSWASIPFAFWQTGVSDDRELLGPIIPPQELTHERLTAELPPASLGAARPGLTADDFVVARPDRASGSRTTRRSAPTDSASSGSRRCRSAS